MSWRGASACTKHAAPCVPAVATFSKKIDKSSNIPKIGSCRKTGDKSRIISFWTKCRERCGVSIRLW
jgi:hypothetical protein